ncbi:MAG: hypothetical protein JNJ83_19895 [Verrucomicrobiaceae bacterium]|nr:hypothetical protein [Verrucomicrobiaceae bacterium]
MKAEPSQPLLSAPDTEEASLIDLLSRAAVVENMIACQYLFAGFSLKKYPGEFDAKLGEQAIAAQLERNRRWGAKMLFTARQEMEHLCMVQNMLAILNRPSWMWRPNFPLPAAASLLKIPNHLMPFSLHALEVFRYYEKPDSLNLPSPFALDALSARIPRLASIMNGLRAAFDGIVPEYSEEVHSVQSAYEEIQRLFDHLFDTRKITARNPNRIVNEHFGFNISLEALVQGEGKTYIDDIVKQILEEGEGAQGAPPLGSHFMAFQSMIDEVTDLESHHPELNPVLPVVVNPSVLPPIFHLGQTTPITNKFTVAVVQLLNDICQLQSRMLTGFFDRYNIDQTTGIHPPVVNAYFQTAFYPMMTMLVRPLGEIVCRLPADADYKPQKGKLPERTAGPTFEFATPQGAGNETAKRAAVAEFSSGEEYVAKLRELGKVCANLAANVPAGYEPLGGRSYADNFTYLSQNLERMAVNFGDYWSGKMVTVVPSTNFQNLDNMN